MSDIRITPFLWFDDQAEEAVAFYLSVFPDARPGRTIRVPAPGGDAGRILTISFFLQGLEFTALNGGPVYLFTPAISFVVHCDTQAEVDALWSRLSDGGVEQSCGWVTDRFGVTWQVVPRALPALLADPVSAGPVLEAMMPMTRLDLSLLEEAARRG